MVIKYLYVLKLNLRFLLHIILVFREYSVEIAKSESIRPNSCKLFGQPTHESHPHLISQGEITPLISKQEFQRRREKLVDSVLKYAERNCAEKSHVVCTLYI